MATPSVSTTLSSATRCRWWLSSVTTASWSQIARAQVELLGDDVGTVLAPTRYDRVAAGFGALGLHVEDAEALPTVLAQARDSGRPVLADVRTGRSDFRNGSISM